MFIDLEQIPAQGKEVDRSLSPEALAFDTGEFRLQSPVQLSLWVHPVDNDGFRLAGELRASMELACVRCLEAWVLKVAERLELLYLPHSANVGPAEEVERALTDEDMTVAFYRDQQIDLKLMVWEQLNLALPMKPLCRPDCAGLCPRCGVNRNVSACQCVIDPVDPRLAFLKTLLKP